MLNIVVAVDWEGNLHDFNLPFNRNEHQSAITYMYNQVHAVLMHLLQENA